VISASRRLQVLEEKSQSSDSHISILDTQVKHLTTNQEHQFASTQQLGSSIANLVNDTIPDMQSRLQSWSTEADQWSKSINNRISNFERSLTRTLKSINHNVNSLHDFTLKTYPVKFGNFLQRKLPKAKRLRSINPSASHDDAVSSGSNSDSDDMITDTLNPSSHDTAQSDE